MPLLILCEVEKAVHIGDPTKSLGRSLDLAHCTLSHNLVVEVPQPSVNVGCGEIECEPRDLP